MLFEKAKDVIVGILWLVIYVAALLGLYPLVEPLSTPLETLAGIALAFSFMGVMVWLTRRIEKGRR